MNTQVKDVGMAVLAIVIIAVALMAFPRIDNAIKSRTMSECAKAASSQTAESGFNGAVYKICVEDAGLKTQIK